MASKGNRFVRGLICLLAFGLASGVGVAPRIIGARVDPHDSYQGQLEPDLRIERLAKNARIMLLDCLPRLIAGHRLPGFQAEPRLTSRLGGSQEKPGEGVPWFALTLAILSLALFARGMVALLVDGNRENPKGGPEDPARIAIRWGLVASTLVIVAAFLVNRTIDNSDNYRYLVFLLIPWSTGFGLYMARMAARRPSGLLMVGALVLAFAGLMTVDSIRWYDRFGWIDPSGRPIRKTVEDPALAWLETHREVSAIFGAYWDVYRLSFLTGGRVDGVPFPEYPDRFPEIKRSQPGGRPRVLFVGPDRFGPQYRVRAMAGGGREIGRIEGLSIVEWPVRTSP